MKKLKLLAGILAAAMLFSACAAVPENVQQDVEDLQKAHEEEKKLAKELNYISVKNVYENTPRNFDYKNGVLTINARVCVPQAEQMYKLALKPNDLYQEKDRVSEFFLDGGACVAGEEMQVDSDVAPDAVVTYNGIEEKAFASKGYYYATWGKREIGVNQCGKLFLYNHSRRDSDEHFIPFDYAAEQEYFYNEIDDDFNRDVKLGGKTYNALDYWKEFQKNTEALKQTVPNFNYKPYSLELYKTEDEMSERLEAENPGAELPFWAVHCQAAYEYQGVCFDPISIVSQGDKNYDISRVDFAFYQSLHCPEDDCLLALRNSYYVTDELEKHDKILDLDSAVKVLQASLAKERFADIETVELMYGMYYYGRDGWEWEREYETPPDFFAEPFWKFKEKSETGEFIVHYVNAFNGDFYSYNQCIYGG